MTNKSSKRKNSEPIHNTKERENSAPDSPPAELTRDALAPHYDQQKSTAPTNTEVESSKTGNDDSFQTDSRPK